MKKNGIILELRNQEAIIINQVGEYQKIRRVEGMFEGQWVEYDQTDGNKARKGVYRYVAVVSGIAAAFVLFFASYFVFIQSPQSEIFAYIDLDVNPSMEFSIDHKNNVVGLKPLNRDAEGVVGSMDTSGMNINKAVSAVLTKLEETGFIKPEKDNLILISASSNHNEGISKSELENNNVKLAEVVRTLKDSITGSGKAKLSVETINLTPEMRKPSKENHMSMGRYALYSQAIEKGEKITPEKAKTAPLNELMSYMPEGSSDKGKKTVTAEKDHSSGNKDKAASGAAVSGTVTPGYFSNTPEPALSDVQNGQNEGGRIVQNSGLPTQGNQSILPLATPSPSPVKNDEKKDREKEKELGHKNDDKGKDSENRNSYHKPSESPKIKSTQNEQDHKNQNKGDNGLANLGPTMTPCPTASMGVAQATPAPSGSTDKVQTKPAAAEHHPEIHPAPTHREHTPIQSPDRHSSEDSAIESQKAGATVKPGLSDRKH